MKKPMRLPALCLLGVLCCVPSNGVTDEIDSTYKSQVTPEETPECMSFEKYPGAEFYVLVGGNECQFAARISLLHCDGANCEPLSPSRRVAQANDGRFLINLEHLGLNADDFDAGDQVTAEFQLSREVGSSSDSEWMEAGTVSSQITFERQRDAGCGGCGVSASGGRSPANWFGLALFGLALVDLRGRRRLNRSTGARINCARVNKHAIVLGIAIAGLCGCNRVHIQIGAPDAGHSDVRGPGYRVDGGVQDGAQFRKPPPKDRDRRGYRTESYLGNSESIMGDSLWSRDYMPEREHTVWLYHGEYFCLDGAIWFKGPQSPDTKTYGVRVFVDFQLVPFHLSKVSGPGGWVARGRFPNLTYDRRETVSVENGTPLNLTLVVPPRALGGRGAHDIRVVFLRRAAPNPDAATVGRTGISNNAYHLKYGGYAPVATLGSFPGVQQVQPTDKLRWNVGRKGVLLYPRAERRAVTSKPVEDTKLAGVYEQSRSSVEMEAMVGGSGPMGLSGGENYYVVLEDGDPVPGLSGTGRTRATPDEITYGSDETDPPWASRLDFEIPLNDRRRHAIRLLSFPGPNRDFRALDTIPTGRDSNVIFLRKK